MGFCDIAAGDQTVRVWFTWVDPLDMHVEESTQFEDRNGEMTPWGFINGGGKLHHRARLVHRRIPGDPDSPLVPIAGQHVH